VALGGHLWLLSDGGDLRPRRVQAVHDRAPVFTVRLIDRTATAKPAEATRSREAPAQAGAQPRPLTLARAAPARPAASTPLAAASAPPLPPDGDAPPALYRTRLPPSFTLAFDARRGAVEGSAELRFTVAPDGYDLTLKTWLQGRDELGLSSRGRIDPHGLAPERHATLRRGRERQAAHFDREAARITYSGPSMVNELLPGAQDRLSWIVQLPSIIAADPDAFGPGTQVRVPVSGARGDAATWVFVVHGATDGVVHLLREPTRPYDTRAEVWLDAQNHHLPLRVTLAHAPAREALELRLKAASP
jgi:hypothetical protein